MNPFDITKAVDYTNEQLNEYWVDFPISFVDVIKPTSQMPMLVLGGKGSGKTHILKYFSYELQKLRYGTNLANELKRDGYIGIYWRCSGLNGARFSNKGYDEDFWKPIFEYYSELWVGILLITILQDISSQIGRNLLPTITTKKIEDLFDIQPTISFDTLEDVSNYLQKLQKELAVEVNNIVFTGGKGLSNNFRIHVSPTKFFFGLPQLLSKEIEFFKGIQFLYLIDEYENLLEYQQKYYNTLVREKEFPTTFKIGARHYGMLTYKTYSGSEEIKEGSEFELFNLDEFLRQQIDSKDNKYHKYVIDICLTKLRLANFDINENAFRSSFEEFDVKQLNIYLKAVSPQKELKHRERLRRILSSKLQMEQVDEILALLVFPQDLLIEKTNTFILYRYIKKNGFNKITNEAKRINKNMLSLDLKEQNKILEYYKNDFIDQLHRENNVKIPYYGFENFIKLSSGIPRTLIRILKEIYKQAEFNSEKPFQKGMVISRKAQLQGIEIACKRILDDLGNSDERVLTSLVRIGSLLQTKRFCDLPPECSISIFRINVSDITNDVSQILKPLKDYSYFIEVNERREKNGDLKHKTFKFNGAIAPLYELSLAKRGVMDLDRSDLNAILDNHEDSFKTLLENEKKKYNFPFSGVNNSSQTMLDF